MIEPGVGYVIEYIIEWVVEKVRQYIESVIRGYSGSRTQTSNY